MASLIFLMQAGFFLLEGGQVRSRDVNNVLMKMTSHLGLGAIVFLVFGFAIKQFGWPFHALPEGWKFPWQFVNSGEHSIAFFVSVTFALVSCAIPSGSFSGRMKFGAYLPLVATNTLMAIAGGITGALAISRWRNGKSDAVITPNGGLAGAVAICSGVHLVHPLFTVLIGILAGAQIPFTSSWLKTRFKLDDPCDVGPVHATPGLLGGIATGLWAPAISHGFHGYSVSLPAQLIATCAALAYAIVAGTLTFKFIGWLMDLRVAPQEEMHGLDISEHGSRAYTEMV